MLLCCCVMLSWRMFSWIEVGGKVCFAVAASGSLPTLHLQAVTSLTSQGRLHSYFTLTSTALPLSHCCFIILTLIAFNVYPITKRGAVFSAYARARAVHHASSFLTQGLVFSLQR
jgi:hypothetical protein